MRHVNVSITLTTSKRSSNPFNENVYLALNCFCGNATKHPLFFCFFRQKNVEIELDRLYY